MKLLLTTIAIAILTGNLFAQDSLSHDYKPFRLDIKLGGNVPRDDNANAGVQTYGWNASIEPNYYFNDYVNVGLHYRYAELFNGFKQQVSKKQNNLVLASAGIRDHFKSDNNFFFLSVEAGVNLYTNKADTAFFSLPAGQKSILKNGTALAFSPHFGWENGKFVVDLGYLFSGNKGANSFSFTLGFYLGGGKKRK